MSIRTQALIFIFFISMLSLGVNGLSWWSFGNQEEVGFLNKTVDNKGPIEETRKKKKDKFAINFLLALFIIKAVILPIAFKMMTIMSSVSVVLSTMSLIISSLVGYTKLAWKHAGPTIKYIQTKEPWYKDEHFHGLDQLGETSNLGHDLVAEPLEHYHYY